MSRVGEAIRKGNGLVCYITAGFPSERESVEYALACVDGGAAVIELGVPFSDPVADGKVIQYTSQAALERGTTPAKVFGMVRELRSLTDVPIILMGYYNPIFRWGEGAYILEARASGVDGLIVPDLPLEESATLEKLSRSNGMDLVQLVGPTTSPARMARIAQRSAGFLYLVSSMGTTGARREMGAEVSSLVARAKIAAGPLPLGVGFGVSRPEHAAQLREAGADAVIVGSAILQKIIDGGSPSAVTAYVHSLVRG